MGFGPFRSVSLAEGRGEARGRGERNGEDKGIDVSMGGARAADDGGGDGTGKRRGGLFDSAPRNKLINISGRACLASTEGVGAAGDKGRDMDDGAARGANNDSGSDRRDDNGISAARSCVRAVINGRGSRGCDSLVVGCHRAFLGVSVRIVGRFSRLFFKL